MNGFSERLEPSTHVTQIYLYHLNLNVRPTKPGILQQAASLAANLTSMTAMTFIFAGASRRNSVFLLARACHSMRGFHSRRSVISYTELPLNELFDKGIFRYHDSARASVWSSCYEDHVENLSELFEISQP